MANDATASDRKILFETPPIARISLGRSSFPTRKLSFPAALNPNLLGLPISSNHENDKDIPNAKRRFSNVSDAVSRKLSTTIGWRNVGVVVQEVASQGRMLCAQYIKQRLKRSGVLKKKSYLTQLRSVMGTVTDTTVAQVTPFLIAAGVELERMYPKLFTSIPRQASRAPGGVMASDKTAPSLLVAISQELLKSDITWGKVVSVFAIAGGLAVDCVCQGHPEYVYGLLEGMSEVMEDDLADWIATNGGWIALSAQCRYPEKKLDLNYVIVVLILIVSFTFLYVLTCFFRRTEYTYS